MIESAERRVTTGSEQTDAMRVEFLNCIADSVPGSVAILCSQPSARGVWPAQGNLLVCVQCVD